MSRRRALSPKEQLHADWLGMLQPEGLVVSIPVLLEADAYVRQPPEVQARLRALAPNDELERATFERLLTEVLDWPVERLARDEALEQLGVAVADLGVVLRPDLALLDRAGKPLIYLRWGTGTLDAPAEDSRWNMSVQSRFERLLLESQTSDGGGTAIGVHACPTAIRLTYAPRGEAPGSLTFPVQALCTWDGRVLVDALLMLLGRARLFTAKRGERLGDGERLPDLLYSSRKRQEQVTVALAGQVEEALSLLLAGIDVANHREKGALLRPFGNDSAVPVRDALVTFMLRTIFLLYCEDAGVLPTDNPLYLENYSIVKLVDRLEEDRVLYPEAMRHRYGAWARLCALFRLVHRGIQHPTLSLPPRQGELFDPAEHPLLEGRSSAAATEASLPPIDDGVVADVLERLIYLENQRLSYRNLDVEQLGSVYEALMGLEVRRCATRTVPVRGGGWLELGRALDAERPIPVLCATTGLKEQELIRRAPGLVYFKVTGDRRADESELVRLLEPVLDGKRDERGSGQHVLVGGAERRKTGSHYTPSSLTQPIVARTLGPVVDRDGPPSSETILNLKVCDPAMGSGAFLAEVCRYLAQRLLDAWVREGVQVERTKGRDPLLVARRMVVERCLYGVDKNPFAVQLARLSMWLITLAKDQPFTFVDHALREGDAVIGLEQKQIANFSFDGKGTREIVAHSIRRSLKDAIRDRSYITGETPLFDQRDVYNWKRQYLGRAQDEVMMARERGDLLLALAWAGGKGKEVKARWERVAANADNRYLSEGERALDEAAKGLLAALPLKPFHWELEFPEVFGRGNPGFDAVVGNPPFGGKNTILASGGDRIIEVFQRLQPHAHGNADFCSWFFLRAANMLRKGGCFGLVATNTIKQGDTRATGLQWMVSNGVTLYDATVDMEWPVVGGAAVVVDVVHGCKGESPTGRVLNSSLGAGAEQTDPIALRENEGKSFIGSYVLGIGFLLSPAEARSLIDANPVNAEIVKPYIGGEELNSNAPGVDGMVVYSRWVIDFGDRSLEQAEAWPELLDIARERVKPQRDNDGRAARRERWWMFAERAPGLYLAIRRLTRGLVTARVSKHHLFAFQQSNRVFSEALVVCAFDDYLSFAVLQSRVHEAWARHAGLGSTMKTDARYTPSTCFETFPFPRPTPEQRNTAAAAGEALDNQRTLCMRRFGEGMTKIWNRLLDEGETDPEIEKLRRLRLEMDKSVLAAYGWSDLDPTDTPTIVTRLRALNAARAAEEKRKA